MRYLDKLAEAKVDKGKTPAEKIKARVARMGKKPDELEQKTRTGPVGDMARSKAQRKARLHTEEGPVTKAANKFAKKKEAESIAKTKKDYEAVYGKRKREDAHTSYQQIGDIIAEARKKLNYKDETDRAIAADKKLKTARGNFRTAKPGSKDQTSALTRQERALKVKQGRLKRAADKMDSIQSHTSYQQIGDVLAEAMLGKTRSKVADKLDKFSSKQYKRGESDEASGKEGRAAVRGRVAHYAGKLAQRVRPKEKSK